MSSKDKLYKDLQNVLNSNSAENESRTPDFILAEFLLNCLDALNDAVKKRDEWHGDKNLYPSMGEDSE